MTDNLALWNAVRTPDPSFTKSFSRGGGFKGTATNVVYLIRCATELWGPMGEKWGVEIKDERYVEGAPILIDGSPVCRQVIHVIRIELRHPSGVVPGIGQTEFVGKNKNGLFTDEEAPKKSLTDALTKAMSWLGFGADIHMGLWDDNKYVSNVRRQYEEGGRDTEEEPKKNLLTAAQVAEVRGLIAKAGIDDSALLDWLGAGAGTTFAKVEDIPSQAYGLVIRSLNKRLEKA